MWFPGLRTFGGDISIHIEYFESFQSDRCTCFSDRVRVLRAQELVLLALPTAFNFEISYPYTFRD
jgi:hypothetical protein